MATPRDPTQFTRDSARRIARIVRAAELEATPANALNWSPILDPSKIKIFRIGTFQGPWPIETEATVTFTNVSSTPNTAMVMNRFYPLDNVSGGECAVAKEKTSWYLISVPLQLSTAQFVDSVNSREVITGISTSRITFASLSGTSVIRTFSTTTEISFLPCETNGTIDVLKDVEVTFNADSCTIEVTKITQTIELCRPGSQVSVVNVSGFETAVGISRSSTQTAVVITGSTKETINVASSYATAEILTFRSA